MADKKSSAIIAQRISRTLTTASVGHIVVSANSKPLYYFAYGSNMDSGQMGHRIADAKFIGTGELQDYKLTMVSYAPRWQGGVANIEKAQGKSVLGVIWEVTEEHLATLDTYEVDYRRVDVDIKPVSKIAGTTILNEDFSAIPCVAYELYLPEDIHDWYPASDRYLDQIESAYRRLGLDSTSIHQAQEFSSKHPVGYGKKHFEDQAAQQENKATASQIQLSRRHKESSPQVHEILGTMESERIGSKVLRINISTAATECAKSVEIASNSIVEGSWILTATELEELFDYRDNFPIELQLTSGEPKE